MKHNMRIFIIISDAYQLAKLKNIINVKYNASYFYNIDEAFTSIIDNGFPDFLVYEYTKDNAGIISLIKGYNDDDLFFPIVLFNSFNEELIENYLKDSIGDFFILSDSNQREFAMHLNRIINTLKIKKTNENKVKFSEYNNSILYKNINIKFTRLEFNLFKLLYLKFNQIVTRKEIQLRVWKFDEYDIFSRSIDTHIKQIRRKLSTFSDFDYKIITVRGKGYFLTNK